ncbi:octopamine receptor 1-like [Actinia tenebrosa]|uniref:Octopamine receptor 1-like n=1 Tax=Actinia tenebrosa TaxID=6105 RepID=A0A6P8IK44_ACTTE|nr:octopamine receptor 1-like [Actinia tenebrosa]
MENNCSTNAGQSRTLLEALNNPIFTPIALFLVLIIIVAICGNLVVIRTVCVTRKLHYPAFYFVVSLAVADLCVGFLVVPLQLVYHVTGYMEGYVLGKWILGEIACDFWTSVSIWFACASLINLCVVSWDRYVAVTSPLTYNLRMRDSKVKLLIGLVWMISLFFGILYTLSYKYSATRVLCTTQGLSTNFTVLAFVLLFLLPTCFIIFVNYVVFKIARTHRRQIDNLEYSVSVSGVTPAPSTTSLRQKTFHGQSIAQKKSQKTYKMLLVIIIAYIVCWTPFFLLLLIQIFMAISESASYMGVLLTYLNSAINPFIYGAFNREFRTAVKKSHRRRNRIGILKESFVPTSQANMLKIPNSSPFVSSGSS